MDYFVYWKYSVMLGIQNMFNQNGLSKIDTSSFIDKLLSEHENLTTLPPSGGNIFFMINPEISSLWSEQEKLFLYQHGEFFIPHKVSLTWCPHQHRPQYWDKLLWVLEYLKATNEVSLVLPPVKPLMLYLHHMMTPNSSSIWAQQRFPRKVSLLP